MKIFLSAVSGQFKACRDALRSDLSAVGAEVVVQEDFQQHGASLLEKLERYIGSCDRIIAVKFPQRYQNSHRIFRKLLCSKNFRQFCGSRNWRMFTRGRFWRL